MRTRLLRGKEGVTVQSSSSTRRRSTSTGKFSTPSAVAVRRSRPALLHSVPARSRPENAAYVVTTALQCHSRWDGGRWAVVRAPSRQRPGGGVR